MRYRFAAMLTCLALALAACTPAATEAPHADDAGVTVGELEITGAWAREASLSSADTGGMTMATPESGGMGMEMSGTNSAAYMTIHNEGGEADRLIKAESDVAKAVELHNVKFENDVMQMFQVEGIDVPANEHAELKPGSFHVMLIGLNRDLKAGEKVAIKLTFEKAGAVTVEAEVRAP